MLLPVPAPSGVPCRECIGPMTIWLAFAYQPAAAVKQRLRGVDVSVSWEDEQIELLE